LATSQYVERAAERADPADPARLRATPAAAPAFSTIAVLALPALALVAVLVGALLAARAGVPFSALSRDPVTELHGPFYVGWLSNVGAMLWCVAAVVCLFGWAVARRVSLTRLPSPLFLIASGLLSALLMADDLLLLHDGLFPHVLHVGERKTLAAYALLVAAYLLRFRRDILATRWLPLAAAFGFFALSLAFDAGLLNVGQHRRHIFEDGSKLIGIAWWCGYFVRTSLEAATAGAAGDAHIASTAPPPEPAQTLHSSGSAVTRVSPGHVALVLAAGMVLLVAAHTAGQWLKYYRLGGDDAGHYFGMIRRFDLNAEGNVPTWYASTLLLLGAALAGYASLTCARGAESPRGPRRFNPWRWPAHRHWLMACLLLLLMSLDEAAELHEKSILPLRKLVGSNPWLHYPWVLPAVLLVLTVMAASLRFLARLPGRTGLLLVASALAYVAGALGMETLGGWYDSLYGQQNFTYALFAGAEETLEMAGVVLFIYAMLDHLKRGDAAAVRANPTTHASV
jgi:hypothetical protein